MNSRIYHGRYLFEVIPRTVDTEEKRQTKPTQLPLTTKVIIIVVVAAVLVLLVAGTGLAVYRNRKHKKLKAKLSFTTKRNAGPDVFENKTGNSGFNTATIHLDRPVPVPAVLINSNPSMDGNAERSPQARLNNDGQIPLPESTSGEGEAPSFTTMQYTSANSSSFEPGGSPPPSYSFTVGDVEIASEADRENTTTFIPSQRGGLQPPNLQASMAMSRLAASENVYMSIPSHPHPELFPPNGDIDLQGGQRMENIDRSPCV